MRYAAIVTLATVALANGQAGYSQEPPTYTDSAPATTGYPQSSTGGGYPTESAPPSGTGYPTEPAPVTTYPAGGSDTGSGYPTMNPSTYPAGNLSTKAPATSTYVVSGSGPGTQTSLVVVSGGETGAPAPSATSEPGTGAGSRLQGGAVGALAVFGGFVAFML